MRNPGSFRDARGFVFHEQDHLFRCIKAWAQDDFKHVEETGLLNRWQSEGVLVPYQAADNTFIGDASIDPGDRIMKLDRIRTVSYPYEWCFSALQAAALLQLRMLIEALSVDVTSSDASAYNIQFNGTSPFFIDHLSWQPYRVGEVWNAHNQFYEQFLYPLLLQSLAGVPFNEWYRGRLEGITGIELVRVAPFLSRFKFRFFLNVYLPQLFDNMLANRSVKSVDNLSAKRALPKEAFLGILRSLQSWISGLKPNYAKSSNWTRYYGESTYSSEDTDVKKKLVGEAVAKASRPVVWDLGCNTGEYAFQSIDAGASSVVGFESDPETADRAFRLAQERGKTFLPLVQNLSNPSPDQGWLQRERLGLNSRDKPDMVLALALIHHMRFRSNIPLSQIVDWIVSLAPSGVIEFPQKDDEMVVQMLKRRDDLFDDYSEDNFIRLVQTSARIERQERLTDTGRVLIHYSR